MSKRIAYPLARNYLVRQPTVVRAGFVFDFPGGKGKEILLDLKEQYGPEPWQRIPTGAAVMRASPDGRFLALNSEWGGILHYRISPEGAVTPLGRIDGRHPFGFSPDGRYLFVSVAKGLYRIFTLPSESDPGFRRVPSPFRAIKDVRLPIRQNHQVTNVKLVDDHLLVLTWHDFFIHDVARNRLRRHFRWGGRSLLITPSRNALVAKMDRSTLVSVDLKTMAIRERSNDYFTLIRRHRVYFDNLISLHPQERYLAALYDPGLIPPGKESLGESRLFVWDLERRQVVWRLRQRLEDPAGGFGYQPPATFTRDWRYFLIAGKDDGLELWRLSKRR